MDIFVRNAPGDTEMLDGWIPGVDHTLTVYGWAPMGTPIRFERNDVPHHPSHPGTDHTAADGYGRFRFELTLPWDEGNYAINSIEHRGFRIGVPINIDFEIWNIIIVPDMVLSLTVGEQTGTMRAGADAGEYASVTFQVDAINAFPAGTTAGNFNFTAGTVTGLPAGVTPSGHIALDADGTSTAPGTLTLTGDGTQIAGLSASLVLTVGSLSSDPFALEILPALGAPVINIGARTGPGIQAEVEDGYVEFALTAENIDMDGITSFPYVVNFAEANVTGTGWPLTGITVSGSISLDADGEGTGTVIFTGDGDQAEGTHDLFVTFLGAASHAYLTLEISAPPTAVELLGNPGTLERTDLDVQLGVTMAALIAADHFDAVGTAGFGTRDGYVFVYDLAHDNGSGLRILPAGLTTLQPGDILRATGRTTGEVGNSRLELARLGAGAGRSG